MKSESPTTAVSPAAQRNGLEVAAEGDSAPTRGERATDRRSFLGASAALLPLSRAIAAPDREPPKVAAIFTEFTHRSHAHVVMENFLEPYLFNGKMTEPGVRVVSFYCDQFPANEMARGFGKDYQIPLFATIDGALWSHDASGSPAPPACRENGPVGGYRVIVQACCGALRTPGFVRTIAA